MSFTCDLNLDFVCSRSFSILCLPLHLCLFSVSFPIMLPLCNPVIPPLAVSCFWCVLMSCIGLSHFHLFSFKYFDGAKCLIYINLCTFHVKKNSARLQWYSCARYKAPGPLVWVYQYTKLAALVVLSKRLHIVLRCTICRPLGLLFFKNFKVILPASLMFEISLNIIQVVNWRERNEMLNILVTKSCENSI